MLAAARERCARPPHCNENEAVAASVQGAHMLGYVLEELGLQAASLHSRLNQRRRLAALHRFKSGADGCRGTGSIDWAVGSPGLLVHVCDM